MLILPPYPVFPPYPSPFTWKIWSFSLLFLYESFMVLAKMECLLFHRCVSLCLIFTYILIILCSWKAPPFISVWPESSIPFKSSWNTISFLKTTFHVLKGCWTALASVAQLAEASSHPKGWWIQFSVRAHTQAAGSIPWSGCMWEVTNPCFSFTIIFCPLSKISQSIKGCWTEHLQLFPMAVQI